MRRAFLLAVTFAAMCVGISGCRHGGKVIPAGDMAEIYARMLLADQWVKDNPSLRKTADTMLLYEPIFRENGYSTADYDRSVHYYLDHPEKYVKMLTKTADLLRDREKDLNAAQDLEDRIKEANSRIRGYVAKDFDSDTILWRMLCDSLVLDSLRLDSLRLDSLRLDSLRLDSLRLDSLRLDSLRLDSLRRDSIRRHIKPLKVK